MIRKLQIMNWMGWERI